VSPDDFTFCPACGASLEPSAAGREVRKTVTIVFCDVTGSTALGERLDPESLRDVQSRYFEAMRVAIEQHGGTVEKYIGDAVMAVFGIPQLHEDDALRAIRAAADMREALAALNKELERDRGVTISVRIGVNSGEVVAGDDSMGRALVTGDAVNVAARLEQLAAPGEILLGDPTRRLVGGAIDAEAVEPLVVKGKADPVPAWRLEAVHDVTEVFARRLDSPMVGRQRQLLQLQNAFEASETDEACQLFTLLGPAGLGKSRVVEEFLRGIGERATVLRGRCLPYGEGITYFGVVQAIKQAAGLADFDPPGAIGSKVCSVLDGDEHQELVCRHISQLIGVAEATAGEETFWAIRRFLEACARTRTLVLVFDDIHWGAPTFLDLVEHIADWSRSPILLLCMARSDLLEKRPTWGGGKRNATTVSLEPLNGEQAASLVANLLGSGELAADVAERIVSTAEGNPLFVEETLAMLIDEGLVVRDRDRWVAAGDLSSVTVPPSIQALLAARLDRLTRPERTVLEAAAVIGNEFSSGAVQGLLPREARTTLHDDLKALVRKELIRPDRSGIAHHEAYRFHHLLIRDAAYEAIPKAQRAELHERFAERLEEVAGDAVYEQEEILGYHLEQAVAYRDQLGPADERSAATGLRASVHLASAGRRAAQRGDSAAAVNLFRRALAVGPPSGADRAAVAFELGEALSQVGDAPAALAAFDRAAELAATAGDRSGNLLALIRRSDTQMRVDPHGKSTDDYREELEEAGREFEELGDRSALAIVWMGLAQTEWMPCRYGRAEGAARTALEHARRSGDERLRYDVYAMLIAAQMYGIATPEEGIRTLEDMLGETQRSPRVESFARYARAFYAGIEGSFDEARRLMEGANEIVEGLGLRLELAVHLEELGYVEHCAGDARAEERAYRQMYGLLDELGDEGHKSTAAASLAQALCQLGRFDEAERYAIEARRIAADDDLISQVTGRSAQATVLAARGGFVEAERLARTAVEMLEGAEAPSLQGDIWMDLARVLRLAGKPAEAERAAREALALYERKGVRPLSAATHAFIEELAGSG
jgi:class 3 adenylate cyclase/tetratricopeptide (TPR) repeat protein